MKRTIFVSILGALLFAFSFPAEAQQTKVYRIGFLRMLSNSKKFRTRRSVAYPLLRIPQGENNDCIVWSRR